LEPACPIVLWLVVLRPVVADALDTDSRVTLLLRFVTLRVCRVTATPAIAGIIGATGGAIGSVAGKLLSQALEGRR
jgi:hypothetical protein